MRALAALGRRAFALTEALAADGVAFDLSRDGLLVAAEDPGAATAFLDGLAPLRELGFDLPQRPFDGDAARELEPALSGAVRAGLVIDDHWTVDPATLTAGLAARLRERGVTLHEHAAVTGFGTHHAAAHEVLTTAGPHVADAVVLAAGAWTPGLARTLGLRVPIRPGKGYSFELPLPAALNRPLMLLDAHVGCTPFRNRLRIAGTMEFSGVNTRLDRRRIDAIVRTAARTLPLAAAHAIERPWTGMRPIAPDGLPIVDRSPRHPNVYLATGYSMLGMTLGAPAGEALAQMILTGQRPSELEPFRADR
jgi:D-amino-acid dehydrogenase